MIIFRFSVCIYIVNSKINENYEFIISPDNGFKIDSIYDLMLFTTPLPVNKIHVFGIRFNESSVINDKQSNIWSNKVFNLVP